MTLGDRKLVEIPSWVSATTIIQTCSNTSELLAKGPELIYANEYCPSRFLYGSKTSQGSFYLKSKPASVQLTLFWTYSQLIQYRAFSTGQWLVDT